MDIRKVIIVSALVAANVLVWHEVFGLGFLVALGLGIVVLLLFRRER
jgi:hypothetical protein